MAEMEADNMATEMTPQERAAALLDRIVGIIPMQPSQREARIEWLVEFAQATRRAALLEARQVAITYGERARDEDLSGGYTSELIAQALDRLAQEG